MNPKCVFVKKSMQFVRVDKTKPSYNKITASVFPSSHHSNNQIVPAEPPVIQIWLNKPL